MHGVNRQFPFTAIYRALAPVYRLTAYRYGGLHRSENSLLAYFIGSIVLETIFVEGILLHAVDLGSQGGRFFQWQFGHQQSQSADRLGRQILFIFGGTTHDQHDLAAATVVISISEAGRPWIDSKVLVSSRHTTT